MSANSAAGALGPGPDPGKYRIESTLGHGSFATSYLARRLADNSRVVLKAFASGEPEIVERYRAEAKISSGLTHPNIVRVIEAGLSNGRPYLVSEYVDGASLQTVLCEGPLAVEDAVKAAIGIATALQYAHQRQIIHRDLKPANILIPGWPGAPRFQDVKLLDFGVAGEIDRSTHLTAPGMTFGTPVYMSPEQVLGEPQTPATDVYGFGLLLYEMIIGRRLREGADPVAIFNAILYDSPAAAYGLMPPWIAGLIRACVQRDPAERPSIEEILLRLRTPEARTAEFPRAAPSAAPRPDPPPAVVRKRYPRPSPAATAAPPAPRAMRSRFIVGAVAAVLVLAAASILFLNPAKRGAQKPAPPATQRPAAAESSTRIWMLLAGVGLAAAGVAAGYWIRGALNRSSSTLRATALGLALDAKSRVDVTATIAMQVTDLVARLRDLDERILAGTVALMLDEYRKASDTKDRQSALMNVVSLSEKLGQRLSPWYVRYKDVIGSAVAAAGAISGLLTAYNGLHGHK